MKPRTSAHTVSRPTHRPHAQVIITGLAFLQNLRCGHYELATETPRSLRIGAALTELAMAI
jgi:hypothetical protein